MNKIFFFAAALVVLLLAESAAFPRPLRTSMGLEHYAAQLEFYYQKPRPEKLRPIMAKLASAGVLDRADNRPLIAAFLSELARSGGIDLKKLFPEKMSRAQRHT
ncbi:MAG: hypothetical protein K2H64_05005, partial [Desulfovibrio sp.]|nr:hypothetical protein [Desulfovibrio sp.]